MSVLTANGLMRKQFTADQMLQAAHVPADDPALVVEWVSRRILACNKAVLRVFGYQPNDCVGKTTDMLHASGSSIADFGLDNQERLNQSGVEVYTAQMDMRRHNGAIFPAEVVIRPIRTSGGRAIAGIASVRDLGEASSLPPTANVTIPNGNDFLSGHADGFVFQRLHRPDGTDRYTFVGGDFLEKHGIDADTVVAPPAALDSVIAPADWQRYEIAFAQAQENLASLDLVVMGKPPSGEELWLRILSHPRRLDDGSTIWFGLVFDITHQKQSEAEFRWLLTHDKLTGLDNEQEFRDELERAVAAARETGDYIAVARIDVRRMSQVNQAYGSESGDALLRELAKRLKLQMRARDSIARSDGDSFTVLLADVAKAHELRSAAERLAAIADERFQLSQDVAVDVGLSIGICRFPEDGESAEALIRAAALAAKEARRHPERPYEVYEKGLGDAVHKQHDLEVGLRRAVKSDVIQPYYQPQISLADGSLVGFEALARWVDDSGEFISPAEFVPLAEETGLIVALGNSMLSQVANDIRRWQDQSRRVPPVSVNCSATQFRVTDFVETHRRLIQDVGIDPRLVVLEITESTIIDNFELTRDVMGQLRRLGTGFSLDDFGVGYSSLTRLSTLEFDMLKIDKSFINGVTTERRSRSIIRALVDMGRALGLQSVAEGVETQDQAAILRTIGCEAVQGFHYSPAVPANQLWSVVESLSKA